MIRLEKPKLDADYYEFYVDDDFCENAYANGFEYLTFWSNSQNSSKKLATQTLEEFNKFEFIFLTNYFDWLNFGSEVSLSSNFDKEGNYDGTFIDLTLSIDPNLEDWSEIFSFAKYREVFAEVWSEKIGNDEILNLADDEKIALWVKYEINFPTNKINEFISPFETRFKVVHDETLKRIYKKLSDRSLIFSFNFPESIKNYCEQYLVYFAAFLKDIGINTTSILKEEAGKVLFSVTPNNDVEALDKIREALAVYLNLPASPIVYDESFAAMRLQQQVENLQHSQKMAVREIRAAEREMRLAQTVIEHQDKIIVQKDSIIEQQNKVIEKIQSKSIMMDSLENKEELEEIYEGLKIGESKFLKEQLGIHLNPAKVIKTAVKNTFGKEDKGKSILGLDEE